MADQIREAGRVRRALLACGAAGLVCALGGCVLLVPVTHGDGGGGTPSQRGETLAPVDMSGGMNLPASTSGTSSYASNRALNRADARSERNFQRLLTQLRNGTPAERTWAATDLGRLRRPHTELIPPLARALRSDDSKWVRRAAARSLGRLGSRSAVPPLREALRDRDRWVAHSAANALSQLGSAQETS